MAQPTDKQFDTLLGISRKMEQSLAAIQKQTESTESAKRNPKGVADQKMGALAANTEALVSALEGKRFNAKSADSLVNFVAGMNVASKGITSQSIKSLNSLSQAILPVVEAIEILGGMSLIKMLKADLFVESVFSEGGLVSKIATGISLAAKQITKSAAEKLKPLGEAISSVMQFFSALSALTPKQIDNIQDAAYSLFIGNNSLLAEIVSGIKSALTGIGEKKMESISALGTALKSIIDSVSVLTEMSLISIMALKLKTSILFGGKNSLFKRIVVGISDSVKSLDKETIDNIEKVGKAVGEIAKGLMVLGKAMAILGLVAIAAPLVLVGALVARAVVGLFVGIGKKAKEIEEGGKAISTLGKGLMVLSAGLAVMILVSKFLDIETIGKIIFTVAAISLTFLLVGKAADSIDKGSKSIKGIGMALIALGAGIAFLSVVLLLVPAKTILQGMLVVAGYALVFAIIGKAVKQVSEGVLVTVLGIAVGLFFFSAALLLLSMAIDKMGVVGAFLGIILISGFADIFMTLGVEEKMIRRGAEALLEIGGALAVFSLGLILYGLALKGVLTLFGNDIVFASAATIVIIQGLSKLFQMLGPNEPLIAEGAGALAVMGVALAVFSVGLILYALALKGVLTLFKNDMGLAAVATVGIVLGLGAMFAGLGILSPAIVFGAIALTTMGVALTVFSVGLILYALALKGVLALFKNDLTTAGEATVKIILGLGTTLAAIGLMSPLILLGSVALIGIGASLLVFSVGLMVFSLAVKMAMSMKLLKETKDGTEFVGTSIIVSLMKGFAESALYVVPALIGAYGSIAISVALATLGVGLASTANALSKIPDASAFTSKLFDEKTGIITVLFSEFAKIGADRPFSMLLGVDPASRGARAVKRMSSALSELAGGIAAFANVDKVPVSIAGPDGKLTYENISLSTTLQNIRTVMIGEDGKGGILLTIAKTFGEIGNMPEVTGDYTVGGSGAEGFFKRMLKRVTGDTPMLRGIRAVSLMGDTLQSLAGGIVAFANVDQIPVQFAENGKLTYRSVKLDEVIANIRTVMIGEPGSPGILLGIAKTFGDIGNMPEFNGLPESLSGGTGGFFARILSNISGDSPMLNGIKAVSTMGNTLQSLAGGITAFANVNEIPVQIEKDGKLIYTSVKLKDVIANIKAVLIGDGVNTTNPGLLVSLASTFSDIGTTYGDSFFDDGPAATGLKAVKEVSDALGGISQTIMAFADMEKQVPIKFDAKGKPIEYAKIDQASIRKNIIEFITSIPTAFAGLDSNTMETAVKRAEQYSSISDVLSKMASPLKNIKEVFAPKGEKEGQKGILTILSEELTNFAKALSGTGIEDTIIASMEKLFTVFEKFSNIADPFKNFADSFKDFNGTFGAFGTNISVFSKNFGAFSTQLSNYDKFAKLLNGHAYYAQRFAIFEPSFAKMSNDLAIFAKNFKSMDSTAIEAFKIWTESLTNFVKVEPGTFRDIADQLEKVINSPLRVQDKIETEKAAQNGKASPTAGNVDLKNSQATAQMTKAVVDRNAAAADIADLKKSIAMMSQQINRLVSALTSDQGINVNVIS